MTRSSDFLGRATLVDYDELGRPVAESRADGMTRSLAYDAVGNLAIADYRGDRRPSLNLTRFARRLTAAAY